MGLCNLYGYQSKKTVKLSDSYSVELWLEKEDFATDDMTAEFKAKRLNMDAVPNNYVIELFNCVDVTLPTFKYKKEIYKYGNNEKTFLIPDYSSLDDLNIELLEYYDKNDNLVVQQLVNLFLNKLFDTMTFTYKLNDYIKQLVVKVYDNNFSSLIYTYTFKNLKLTNYTKYDLDYSSNNPAKWKLSFSYMEYEAAPVGTGSYGTKGETDPNVQLPEQATESNIDFAAMYAAMMSQRSNRAPSDSNSMLTPNAYSNNSEAITDLKKQTKSSSKKLEAQQAAIEESKTKVEELEAKIAEAEAKFTSLNADIAANEAKYNEAKEKTQGLMQDAEKNKMTKNSSEYWTTAGYQEDLQKARESEAALNANLELRKETSDKVKTATAELEETTANLKAMRDELEAEQKNLSDLTMGFNNIKAIHDENVSTLTEMESIRNDQIESLENRFGSSESIEQRNRGAQTFDYAQSMSTTVEPTEEEMLHTGASNLASTLWDGRNDRNNYDELHALNESNKLDMDLFDLEYPENEPIIDAAKMEPVKTEPEPIKAESKIETVFTRSDKILALTQEYEKTHPEWSDAYIYEHASNVVDKELGLVETVEAPKKETKSAKTIISSYLNNDNVAGKDVVSQGMIDEINTSSRSRAETVEFKPKSVEELKAGIDKFTNPNDESLYVVSVDPSKISGLTRWGIKTAGGDEAEKFLDNGYSFTIYKGNVNGVGNINTQKDAWLNQFSDYEFFANRILQNGGVEFKVAKITPKNDN